MNDKEKKDLIITYRLTEQVGYFIQWNDLQNITTHEVFEMVEKSKKVEDAFNDLAKNRGLYLDYNPRSHRAKFWGLVENCSYDVGNISSKLYGKFMSIRCPSSVRATAEKAFKQCFQNDIVRYHKVFSIYQNTERTQIDINFLAYDVMDHLKKLLFFDGFNALQEKINSVNIREFCLPTIFIMGVYIDQDLTYKVKYCICEAAEMHFMKDPNDFIWKQLVTSPYLISAIKRFPPLWPVVQKVLRHQADAIKFNKQERKYQSLRNHLTFDELTNVTKNLLGHEETRDSTINFVGLNYARSPGNPVWKTLLAQTKFVASS